MILSKLTIQAMLNLIHSLRNIWYPERYHGAFKESEFFEGWYYKFENEHHHAFALIVGVSIGTMEKTAFIQFVDGQTHKTLYFKFDFEQFLSERKAFSLQLGKNSFTKNHVYLDLPSLKGELFFSDHVSWQKSILAPNIMGPLSYFPFLECNHSIVSLSNTVKGEINLEGRTHAFQTGKGYIEKDWGRSFPKAHIWLQSSHFSSGSATVSVAIARMKILGKEVLGYAASFMLKEEHYLFSSYNFSKLVVRQNGKQLVLLFKNKRFELSIETEISKVVALKTPTPLGMNGLVQESLNACLNMTLKHQGSQQNIYVGKAYNSGLEVSGDW